MTITLYKGSIGIILNISTTVDLTTASTTYLKVVAPYGASINWIGSKTATPADGIISYTIQSGDLDDIGNYIFQSYIVMVDGSTYIGDPVTIKVKPVI
jgi:hypothetical protein